MKSIGYIVFLCSFIFSFGCGIKQAPKKKVPQEVVVEFYARQFDWTARFPGKDNILGKTDFRLASEKNVVGLITSALVEEALTQLFAELDSTRANMKWSMEDSYHGNDLLDDTERRIKSVRKLKEECVNKDFSHSNDDIIVRGEIHLPVGDTIDARFRSRDVIHGAYFPHFRIQANCVPGMTNRLKFAISITTEEMRKRTDNPQFDYLLLCNNICGAFHFQMQMKIVVESREDFEKWLSKKKTVSIR